MSRPQSSATQVRHLKAQLTKVTHDLSEALTRASEYRQRASKAETEAAEWRKRFDILLSKGVETKPATDQK